MIKRRTKSESLGWDKRIHILFDVKPEAKEVGNRYKALRALLLEVHQELGEIPKEKLYVILKDCVYLDRKLRLCTEGLEVEKKKELSDEFIVNELM